MSNFGGARQLAFKFLGGMCPPGPHVLPPMGQDSLRPKGLFGLTVSLAPGWHENKYTIPLLSMLCVLTPLFTGACMLKHHFQVATTQWVTLWPRSLKKLQCRNARVEQSEAAQSWCSHFPWKSFKLEELLGAI